MTALIVRMAFAGIRSRPLASILTILLTGAVAATVVLTLEVGATARAPWMETFEAAHGAHVLASVPTEADARMVTALPGVSEHDLPVPMARATMTVNGREVVVFLAGLNGQPRINAPVMTEGAEVRDGTVVFERSLARALEISTGIPVTFTASSSPHELLAAGTAISPSQPRYPIRTPGLAWVTRSTLEQIEPDQNRWHWLQPVRLTDPSTAPAFAAAAGAVFPPGTVYLEPWQEQRANALRDTDLVRLILAVYAMLLLIVCFAVITILIGARVSSQHREIGLLKAIGLTPRQVSLVFVIEAGALGVVGIVAGFVPGALLAPRLAAPAAVTLLASPERAANPWHAVVASLAILPVIVVSAYASARRSTRATVLQALRAGAVLPAPRSRLQRAITSLSMPVPMMLGLSDLLARRSRSIWLMFAFGITAIALVVTLSVQAALDARPAGEVSDVPSELPMLLFTLDIVLAVITMTALVAVALLSVRERIREFGVLKAIGLTPSQISSSLAGAHTTLALVASTMSIPAGIGLYILLYWLASGSTDAPGIHFTWWWLAAVPMSIAFVTAVTTLLPARYAAHIPAADAVRYE